MRTISDSTNINRRETRSYIAGSLWLRSLPMRNARTSSWICKDALILCTPSSFIFQKQSHEDVGSRDLSCYSYITIISSKYKVRIILTLYN